MSGVVVIGSGGHGRVIADILRARGDQLAAFLDDQHKGKIVLGAPVMGGTEDVDDEDFVSRYAFIVGLGDTRLRRKISEKIISHGGRLATAIHPTATVALDVMICEGTVVMAGAIINTGSRIGKFAVINTGAIIDHDNVLEDGVHISPGCNLAGGVYCYEDAFIGTGATIIPRTRIGRGSVVAAGATVTSDVAPNTMVAGTPAKFKRTVGN